MRYAWTDEKIAEMTRLWKKGLTMAEIADQLGGASRNAVIGKIHRLGIQEYVGGRKVRKTERAPKALSAEREVPPKKAAAIPAQFRPDWNSVPQAPTFVKTDIALPESRRVTLIELGPDHCRWIVDGRGVDATYCGGPRINAPMGSVRNPYCESHSAIAHAPAANRPAQDKKLAKLLGRYS